LHIATYLSYINNAEHIFETLKLCIQLNDKEYVDKICNILPAELPITINWKMLQYEANQIKNYEILRRMIHEELIRSE
jgi:hypothetical protein